MNEPPTSLSKLTKNVNDYLDKPSNIKTEPASASTTTVTEKPETTKPETTKPETTTAPPKAQYLNKTDPNETGRNIAEIVFGEEEEEAERYEKFLAASSNQGKAKEPDEKSTTDNNQPENK